MLLREEIEQSFGNGPAHRPIEDVLVAGRRGVRRRRTVTGLATAVATIAVLGATYAVTAPGSGGNGSTPIATDPAPSSAPAVDEEGNTFDLGGDAEVTLTEDGELVLGPDVVVRQQVDNPMHVSPPEYSVGLDVAVDGERQWILLGSGPGSGWGVSQLADGGSPAEFEQWVADSAEDQPGEIAGNVSPETEAAGDGQGRDAGSKR
jgi:hypothetical protein